MDIAVSIALSHSVYNAQVELVPGGKDKVVTNSNKAEYALRMANFRLNVETRKYTDAFRHGMEYLIQPEWLSMFNEEELQMLVAGIQTHGLDISDLMKHVQFGNGYTADHPTIQLLWQASNSLIFSNSLREVYVQTML